MPYFRTTKIIPAIKFIKVFLQQFFKETIRLKNAFASAGGRLFGSKRF